MSSKILTLRWWGNGVKYYRTQAAISAGYSPKTAYSIGAELLKKTEIEHAISQRLRETAMGADEVMMRLAEHARGNIDDYLADDGQFNLSKARKANKTGLIKKLKTKRTTWILDDIEYVTTEVEFELYDAQSALQLIGKHHRLFVDKTEITGEDGGQIPIIAVQPGLLQKLTDG